jgi:F-type H+-transporting ATPase subunit b
VITTAFTQFATSTSGIGALGIDGQAFLIQFVTFILALLILRQFAFKPILNVLRRRRELIDQGVKLGEQMQKQQVELDHKVSTTLHKARQQADDIIAEAEDQARQTVQASEDKARDKATLLLDEAKGRIELEKARVQKEMEGQLVDLIADVTEVIIDEKVDTKKDAALIDRALKESKVA